MIELKLSIIQQSPEDVPQLRKLLEQFKARSGIRVEVSASTWSTGWDELVKVATYNAGPDVSTVGTTWVPDLAGMNALRAFTQQEVQNLGTAQDFYPASWQSTFVRGDNRIVAVPWVAGVRVIYYRRDWLAQAGIPEEGAFATASALANTLKRLHSAGVSIPWAVTTQPSLNTTHHLSSWVWGAGGDWVAEDGLRLNFMGPATLAGMRAYFDLWPFLGPNPRELTDASAFDLFWQGQAAATIDGHWFYSARQALAAPEVLENLGVAQVPGVPFVGGTNLVIWKHTRHPEAAVDLLRFLTQTEIVLAYDKSSRLLPARLGGLDSAGLLEDPVYRIIANSLQTGRAWPSVRFGSLLENNLRTILGETWRSVLADTPPDIDGILTRLLYPAQRRIEANLGSG